MHWSASRASIAFRWAAQRREADVASLAVLMPTRSTRVGGDAALRGGK